MICGGGQGLCCSQIKVHPPRCERVGRTEYYSIGIMTGAYIKTAIRPKTVIGLSAVIKKALGFAVKPQFFSILYRVFWPY